MTGAAALLDERGWPGFSIDEVARRSGVGKATIYKHWAGRFPLAVEAYGRQVTAAVPTLTSGEPTEELIRQVIRLNAFYRSAPGQVVAQLLGAAASEPNGTATLRELFFEPRREPTIDLVESAVATRRIRADLPVDLVIDLLFGAVVFRLFNGQPPLDDAAAESIARAALTGLQPTART